MQRIKNVLNVHFVDRKGTFLVPLYIFSAMVAVVVAIGIIAKVAGANQADLYTGMMWNGAVWALLGMGFGIGAMTMTQYFSFALGMGITRREWLAGSFIMFVLVAAGNAIVITALKVIEQQTNGLWLYVRLFDTVWTGPGEWWKSLIQVFLLVITAMTITGAISGVWARWGKSGLMWLGAVALLIGLVIFGLVILLPASALAGFFGWIGGFTWGSWMLVLLISFVLSSMAVWFLGSKAEVR